MSLRTSLLSIFAFALALASSALAASTPPEKAGDNLCTGGDFEGDALSQHWKWNDNRGTFSAKKGPGLEGEGSSAKLVSTGTGGRGKFYTKGFSIPAGSDVRVTLWAKAENLVGGVWVNYERGDEGLGKFDLIIGSDLLYERGHAELLSNFINHRSKPHCEVIIIDPGRSHHTHFSKKMVNLGYSHSQSRPDNIDYLEKPFPRGKILRYQR